MAQEPTTSRSSVSSTSICGALAVTLLVLSTFVVGPLVVDANRIPGTFPDLWVTLWSAKWCLDYLHGGVPSLFFTPMVFYPEGSSLLLHNLSEGMFIPLGVVLSGSSPEALYRFSVLLAVVLNGGAAFLLAKRLSHSTVVASWIAFLWGTHPFFLAHIAGGHLNQLSYFTLPLALVLILRISERRTRFPLLEGTTLGGLVAWSVFLDYYQLFLLGVLLGVSAVVLVIGDRRRVICVLTGIALPALLGLLLAAPKLIPAIELMQSARYTPNHDPAKHGADPITYLLPGETQQLGSLPLVKSTLGEVSPNSAEGGNYLGWSLLALVAVAFPRMVRRDRRIVVFCFGVALFFALASLGPVVRLGDGSKIPSPFYALFVAPMPFAFPVPARLAVVAILALMVAVCVASRTASKRTLFAVLFLSLIEFAPRTLGTTVIGRSDPGLAPFDAMRGDSSIAYVIDLDTPERAMFHQVLHERPLLGGFFARRPRRGERLARNNPVVTYLEREEDEGVAEWLRANPGGVVAIPARDLERQRRAASAPSFQRERESAEFVTYRLIPSGGTPST